MTIEFLVTTTKFDFIWNYVGTVFRLGINFLILPLLMIFLSDDMMGLWYIFLAIGSLVTLLQIGFAPALARNIAYCMSGASDILRDGVDVAKAVDGKTNYDLLSNVINVSRYIYLFIAVVAIVLLSLFGTLYVFSIADSSFLTVISWVIFCVAVFLNILFGYYESMLRGIGNFEGLSKSIVISSAIQLMLTFVFFLCGFSLLAPVIGYAAQGVLFRFLCGRFFWSRFDSSNHFNKKILKCKLDKAKQKQIFINVFPNAAKDGVVMISNYLATQANTILASAFLNLGETGFFSLSIQLIGAAGNLASVMATTNYPAMQQAYAHGALDEERNLIAKSSIGYILVYALLVLILWLIIFPLISYVRPSYVFDNTLLALLFMYYFLWKQQSNFAAYISNRNEVPYALSFVLGSIGGVVVSALLLSFGFGIYGLVVGQLIAQNLFNGWYWVRYVCRNLEVGYFKLLKNGFSKFDMHNFRKK